MSTAIDKQAWRRKVPAIALAAALMLGIMPLAAPMTAYAAGSDLTITGGKGGYAGTIVSAGVDPATAGESGSSGTGGALLSNGDANGNPGTGGGGPGGTTFYGGYKGGDGGVYSPSLTGGYGGAGFAYQITSGTVDNSISGGAGGAAGKGGSGGSAGGGGGGLRRGDGRGNAGAAGGGAVEKAAHKVTRHKNAGDESDLPR